MGSITCRVRGPCGRPVTFMVDFCSSRKHLFACGRPQELRALQKGCKLSKLVYLNLKSGAKVLIYNEMGKGRGRICSQ